MSYIKKKHKFIFLGFVTLVNCSSCGNNVSLSPKVSRFIASEHLKKFTPKEIMAKGIKQFITEEQKISSNLTKSGTFSSPYSPKNNPKFPLPYYLVSEESAHFFYTNNLDPRISGQLSMKISGKKHYKFFIHPELETHFDYLRLAFSYVGADKTEFWATPTSNYRSLVVWNKNNPDRKPFIAKISLDKKTSHELSLGDEDNDIERILTYQRYFENIGDNKLSQISLNYFPETAGMDLEKIHPFKHEKIQAQSIQEIPDELLLDKKHWTSLATLIEAQTSHPHQLMEFITKSGMSSYQFVEDQMINQYLKIVEELSLKKGIQFESTSQNLLIETSPDLKLTGKWVLRNFEHYKNDILSMARSQGPLELFMLTGSAHKFNFSEGRISVFKNYTQLYREETFDQILAQLAKNDPQMTTEKVKELRTKLDTKFIKLINHYFTLNVAEADLSNYKKLEQLVIHQALFDQQTSKKEIIKSNSLTTFIDNKKSQKEWLELTPPNQKTVYFLTSHGLYAVEQNKIAAFALFSKSELEDYKSNNKMLSIFTEHSGRFPAQSCARSVTRFLKEDK